MQVPGSNPLNPTNYLLYQPQAVDHAERDESDEVLVQAAEANPPNAREAEEQQEPGILFVPDHLLRDQDLIRAAIWNDGRAKIGSQSET